MDTTKNPLFMSRDIDQLEAEVDEVIRDTDKAIREYDEREARRNEREKLRRDLIDRYKKLWTDNYRKLLNDPVDQDYLFDLEEELRKWMHDLHIFTMKFVDEKIIFNLHWEAFHIGQLLGLVEMKLKCEK